MRKELTFFFILFLFSITLSSQPDHLPAKGIPFKYGKYLLYFDFHSEKSSNSTILDFQLYDKTMHLAKEYHLVVENITGKFGGIAAINEIAPGRETIEISLSEKMLSGKGIIIKLNAEFKIISRKEYDYKSSTPYDVATLPETPFSALPPDHFFFDTGTYGYSELDGKTADGSVIYLNYDMSNACPAGSDEAFMIFRMPKSNITKTTLCFFKANEKDYQLKWKLDIDDKKILLYKVYIFGNDLFLYTSYYVGDPADRITAQMIRKIDINTGELIYKKQLETKNGYELMLSNVEFDKATQELIFCGNYITTLSDKEYKTPGSKLSIFFIAKITAEGKYSMKEIELKVEKPANVNEELLDIPFLCVKKLVKNKAGDYVAAAQYNYLLPTKYKKQGVNEYEAMYMFKHLTAGFSAIIFDGELNIISQETNMFTFNDKRPAYHGYMNMVLRLCIVGTLATDRFSRSTSYWNAEEDCLIISQNTPFSIMSNQKISLYALKLIGGKKESFKAITGIQFRSNDKGFGFFIMDPKTLIYYITGSMDKNEFTTIEL